MSKTKDHPTSMLVGPTRPAAAAFSFALVLAMPVRSLLEERQNQELGSSRLRDPSSPRYGVPRRSELGSRTAVRDEDAACLWSRTLLRMAVPSFKKRIENTCRLRARNAPAQLSR